MRLRSIITPVAVAVAGYAMARNRRRQRARSYAARDELASDPRDPVQSLEDASELQVTPLDVDALSTADVEAAQDLALLESELDDIIDDEEVLEPPHASDTRDRPVADQGSGGRRGL